MIDWLDSTNDIKLEKLFDIIFNYTLQKNYELNWLKQTFQYYCLITKYRTALDVASEQFIQAIAK